MNEILNWVWENSKADNKALLALIRIADVSRKNGYCTIKHQTLAKAIRVIPGYVPRLIKELENLGELEVIRKPGRVNQYNVKTNSSFPNQNTNTLECNAQEETSSQESTPPPTPEVKGPLHGVATITGCKPEDNPLANSSESLAPPRMRKRTLSKEGSEQFEKFWEAYPKKKDKEQKKEQDLANKEWGKINPDSDLFNLITASLEKWKQSELWNIDNGKYIKHPQNWLKEKYWEKEIPIPKKKTNNIKTSKSSNLPYKKSKEEFLRQINLTFEDKDPFQNES